MGFGARLKVVALCVATMVSNLVSAAEARVVNTAGQTRVHQNKRATPQQSAIVEDGKEVQRTMLPDVAGESEIKQAPLPVEKQSPPLELKGVRG